MAARKKRRRTEPYTEPLAHANQSNRVWCADFKGWFKSGDGTRVDPLIITDAWSRYLLGCQAVEKTDTARVRAIFGAAFPEQGFSEAIRTDNGASFASTAVGGLSRLRCGGSSWASRTNAFRPATRSRTATTNPCTAPVQKTAR